VNTELKHRRRVQLPPVPRSCVFRNVWAGGVYLGRDGHYTLNRPDALRTTLRDGRFVLLAIRQSALGKSDPMFKLSMEEVPKRERRKYPPTHNQPLFNAFIAQLRATQLRESAHRLEIEAVRHELLAQSFRKQAAEMMEKIK
jgi:hypothetical protein